MMIQHQVDGVVYLSFPVIDEIPFAYNAFSTRTGGISKGIFSSMNLSFGRGDDDENVIRNYEKVCHAIDIKTNSLVFASQTHTSNILEMSRADCGKGIYRQKDWKDIDGLITADTDVTLVGIFADCVPIVFIDPEKRVVAMAHAGWKGTVLQIAPKMISRMQSKYFCDPEDIIVGIGPSIGKCCFEVDENTAEEFMQLPDSVTFGCISKRQDVTDPTLFKYDIDLQEINRNELIQAGVPEDNIQVANLCTKCNRDLFFSHRATKGLRGGMAAMIGMRS
ncbi:MAG: peptidoglycan editing factor PgeF [Saccharofermentanales bacterium]